MLRRAAEEDESTDSKLERFFDARSLGLVAAAFFPADRGIKELGDLTHAGVRFPRTRGPRAPVADGTFPG